MLGTGVELDSEVSSVEEVGGIGAAVEGLFDVEANDGDDLVLKFDRGTGLGRN